MMTDHVEECGYPACSQPAAGHLMRPFKKDRVALCVKHKMMAEALLDELAKIDQERRS
jgi:hypothetical protein